jgi:hypothetical protein
MPAASSSLFTARKCRPCYFASANSEMYSRAKRSTSSAGTTTVGQRLTGLMTVADFRCPCLIRALTTLAVVDSLSLSSRAGEAFVGAAHLGADFVDVDERGHVALDVGVAADPGELLVQDEPQHLDGGAAAAGRRRNVELVRLWLVDGVGAGE